MAFIVIIWVPYNGNSSQVPEQEPINAGNGFSFSHDLVRTPAYLVSSSYVLANLGILWGSCHNAYENVKG